MGIVESEKPALVIMAAGMGSRYGGPKQIDPVGPKGELIIDYSMYDALKAGFEKVICVIKRSMADDFNEVVGSRSGKRVEIIHAYQEISDLPEGFEVPNGRVKPWGTAHALMAAKGFINGPFAVINADDYYGPTAYKLIYEWLAEKKPDDGGLHYAMAGYLIENTLTDHGSVARGVCREKGGYLDGIVERTMVEKTVGGAKFSEDKGETWERLPEGTLVSMNFWGLDRGFLDEAAKSFPEFLRANLGVNPLTCEHLLPTEIDRQIQAGMADVRVLKSPDKWHGVTYQADKPRVVAAIRAMHEKGTYPTPLWAD
jgi:hypothetical protein